MVPNLQGECNMHKKMQNSSFVQDCSEKSQYFAMLPLVTPQNDI